ncbi:unnamed protein product [Ectocarpus sp. CCAP 1310/34]|nr:unnamed protein product [Ectocarpus sp. CCAP 1310/34]
MPPKREMGASQDHTITANTSNTSGNPCRGINAQLCVREQQPQVAAGENIGPGSCRNSVCYEAHLELAGELLARGGFERCTEICGHILRTHDANDMEALFSLAQALEALGRSEEALKYARAAESLKAAASEG